MCSPKKRQPVQMWLINYAMLWLLLMTLPGTADAQLPSLDDLIATWRAQQYELVAPRLIEYRKGPYGKNVQVDYMLATSFCRMQGMADIGKNYFARILASYELSDDNRAQIERERERCAAGSGPLELVFVTGRSTAGGDVGIRGKTFYWLDRRNAPLGGDPIASVRDIAAAEIKARLFRPGEQDMGTRKIQEVAGRNFLVSATERFVIASSSGQTPQQLRDIGNHLEAVMRFFNTSFGMPMPPYMISVYLTPDPGSFRTMAQRIHGLRLSEGSIGYSYRDDLSLAGVVTGAHAGTLKHELFHLMVRNNFGDIPPWLDEGMAALYEVSQLEDGRVRGLRNWREDVLKRFWTLRPSVGDLLRMDWQRFDASGNELERQAVNHAAARYLVLYLQGVGKLVEVYMAFRDQRVEDMAGNSGDEAVKLLEATLRRPLAATERDFEQWFEGLGKHSAQADIVDLQRRLNELHFNVGKADGILGPKTRQGLRAFQAAHGMRQTGEPDAATRDALQALTGKQ